MAVNEPIDQAQASGDLFSPEYGINRDFFNQLREALAENDADQVRYIIHPLHPADLALIIEDLTVVERRHFVEIIRQNLTGEVLAQLEDNVREMVVEQLSNEELAAALTDLETDDATYILENLDDEHQRQVLDSIPAADRLPLEETLAYPEDSAGRLMQREVVTASQEWTLGQIVNSLEKYTDLPDSFYEIYLLDENNVPKGSIALSKILRYPRRTLVADVMEKEIVVASVTMEQENVVYLFKHYGLFSVPVVEADGHIVGMVTIDDVVEFIDDEAGSEILKMGGVSEENYHGTISQTCISRLHWLLVTCINSLIAANVISHFEPVLEQIVVLAFLMPIVASMGGNVGMQVVTVTVRALSTHHLKSGLVFQTLRRELSVSFIIGIALSLGLSLIVIMWFGDWRIGAILGCALLANVMWAGLAGTLVPYFLDRLNMDPAISAGPLLTTTTDVLGFAVFLGLATIFLL